MAHPFLFTLIAATGLALAQTKPPAPVLMGEPIPRGKLITVRISGLADQVAVKIYRDGTEDKDLKASPPMIFGEVELTLSKALSAGEIVTLTQTIGGLESPPSAGYRVPAIAPPSVEILSAQAFLAYNLVPVTFKVSHADTVTFKIFGGPNCSERRVTQEVSGDELKKGKADIALAGPLDSSENLCLTYLASHKGALDKAGVFKVDVIGLDFRLDGPPTEGQQELKGKAGSFIKGMVVYVLGGAFPESRIPAKELSPTLDKLKTNFKARLNIETIQRGPATSIPLGMSYLQLKSRLNEVTGDLREEDPPKPKNQKKSLLTPNQKSEEEKDYAANDLRDEIFHDSASIEKGAFTFTLKQRLEAGQRLVICALVENEPGLSRPFCDERNHVVQSVAIDFGRLRAYFSAGTVISAQDGSFGKAAPYLAFNADFAFANALISKIEKKSLPLVAGDAKPAVDSCEALDCLKNRRFGFSLHAFLDVRLTQAATDSKAATPLTAVAVGPTPQQAGVAQMGFYLPMRVSGMDWVYRGTQYSAYFAPVGKFGITHLKDGVILNSQDVTTKTTVQDLLRPDAAAKVTNSDPATKSNATQNALPFYGYGLRLGLMRYELMGRTLKNRQIAPDNSAYVDFTYGQNGIYRRKVEDAAVQSLPRITTDNMLRTTVQTTSTNTSHLLVPGFNIEGRMKLPYLPAQIGVDIFLHRRLPDQSASSDFRFILGFRVDVAKALSRAFGMAP